MTTERGAVPDPIAFSRWTELEPLLDAALDREPDDRDAAVAQATASDPALRAELEALLREAARTTLVPLLDRSAGEIFSSLLGDDSEIVAHAFATELSDRYVIRRRVGAGGMATVYLAHDVRHDREVAIKILRPDLAVTIGAERFLAEIRIMARLQHPHLLPLLDSGEAGGQLFYVMPYVSGESLRARLQREGMLPVDMALRITREIATALDYAHRHGVIHRDIKPENVLLLEGQAIVADWGIALIASAAERGEPGRGGIQLGTPQYMSPEQVTGDRPVDVRSDIHALGCVLYEMLAGAPAFAAETTNAILERVRADRPAPPSTLRASVPPPVDAAVVRALAKIPADRFQSMVEFIGALDLTDRAAPAVRSSRTTNYVLAATVAALTLALGVMTFGPDAPPQVTRLSMALPPGQGLASAGSPRLAISPDGNVIVYVGPGPGESGHQLWLKKRDQLSGVALAGTDGAEQPVFAPDGRRIAYYLRGPNSATLMTIGVDGGPALSLATSERIAPSEVSTGGFRAIGLAWGNDGYIYMDGQGGWGVRRVRADGGPIEQAATRDTLNELAWWPDPLPGTAGVLVTLGRWNSRPSQYRIAIADPINGGARVLANGTFARYLTSGHLLYLTAEGALMAAPFDVTSAVLTGPAVKLVDGIDLTGFGAADLAVSRQGMLVYVQGTGGSGSTPVWVSRDGRAEPVDSADRSWRADFGYGVALSPDGSRLAYATTGDSGAREVWMRRLPNGPLSRVSLPGDGTRPDWRDDTTLLFLKRPNRDSQMDIWTQRADGSAPAAPFVNPGVTIQEYSMVAATPWVALRVTHRDGSSDLMRIRPGIDSAPIPLLTTTFEERVPTLSRDGRFIAYVSNESGRQEVWVRPFPDVHAGRWQVSAAGGTAPLWSRNGRELFYLSEGNLMSATVGTSSTFSVTSTRALFSVREFAGSVSRAYDEAPDGRFVMFRRDGGPSHELVIVEHFSVEVRARVGR